MPIVLSNKQRIYYCVEGERGPFVLLYPPFLESAQSWYRFNYVEKLKDQFRLILIDPLGQGRSDTCLVKEQYTLESRATHVIDIMEELKVSNFHFFGIGLGGQVGFFMASHFPRYLRSLATIDAHPYAITTELQKTQEIIQILRTEGVAAYLKNMKLQEEVSPEREATMMQGIPNAYAFALEGICQWEGIGKKLNSILTPSLLFTATEEEKFLAIREAGRMMSRARYLILPELSYKDGFVDAELIVPHFIDFIRKLRWSE
ncbi:MAG: alpha/beta fold hydrolase [SAR324 cluster bacterium]|nr:alpha/beta fold hydrolase [SAR324 cluster bacterium]